MLKFLTVCLRGSISFPYFPVHGSFLGIRDENSDIVGIHDVSGPPRHPPVSSQSSNQPGLPRFLGYALTYGKKNSLISVILSEYLYFMYVGRGHNRAQAA